MSSEVENVAVKVCIRIRPHNKRELNHAAAAAAAHALPLSPPSSNNSFSVDITGGGNGGEQQQQQQQHIIPPSILCIESETHTIHLLEPDREWYEREAFQFDRVFWSVPLWQTRPPPGPCENMFSPPKQPATQEDVFNELGLPAVEQVIRGCNSCLFAYGQTGAGKSYSMLGAPSDPGVAPRFVNELFRQLHERKRAADASESDIDKCEVKVELGFLEIYNEKVRDLLLACAVDEKKAMMAATASSSASSSSSNLKSTADAAAAESHYSMCRVRHHPERGTFVEGLQRKLLNNADECLAAIEAGMSQRSTSATSMNDTSSRSHGILQLVVTQRFPAQGTTRTSLVNLVDLAGSERVKQSGVSGQALVEATKINGSLSCLRRVIDVLIDNANLKKGQKATIPPYRESLLTWVLSDSLGGNSKTCMLATASPNALSYDDTLSTLRYALKAKSIVCSAKVNEEKSNAVLSSLKTEMLQLREQLDLAALKSVDKELAVHQAQIREMELAAQRYEEHQATTQREMERRRLEIERAEEMLRKIGGGGGSVGGERGRPAGGGDGDERVEDLARLAKEKERVEEELRVLREKQVADERRLQLEAVQRHKAESELQQATEARRRVEVTAERQEQELSAAMREEEQMRVRQLLTTLQSAFVRFIAGRNLAQLRNEKERLVAALAENRSVNDCTSHRHHQLRSCKVELDSALEFLQKKIDKVQHHELLTSSSNALRDRRVLQLRKQQAAAKDELEQAMARWDGARLELDRVKVDRQQRHSDFLVEKARLETEIAELDRQAGHAQNRIDHHLLLVQEHEESETDWRAREKQLLAELAKMSENNQHRSTNIAALKDALAREGPACAALLQKLQHKEYEYGALNRHLCAVIAAVDEAQARSTELRQQMDGVFLPPTPRLTQPLFRTGTNQNAGSVAGAGSNNNNNNNNNGMNSRATTPRGTASHSLTRGFVRTSTSASASVSVAAPSFSRTGTAFSSVASVSPGMTQHHQRLKAQHRQGDVRGGGVHFDPPLSAKTTRRSVTPRQTVRASSSFSSAHGAPFSRNATNLSVVSAASSSSFLTDAPAAQTTPGRHSSSVVVVPSLRLGGLLVRRDVVSGDNDDEQPNSSSRTPMHSAKNNNNNNNNADPAAVASPPSPLTFAGSDSFTSPSPFTPAGRRRAMTPSGISPSATAAAAATAAMGASPSLKPHTSTLKSNAAIVFSSPGQQHVRPRLGNVHRAFR